MRRISPAALRLALFGGVLLLSLFGAGTGVIAFLLLRAGYGFVVWGVLPFLALVLVVIVFGAVVWWLTGGNLLGTRRSGSPEEKPHEGSRREESRGGDDV